MFYYKIQETSTGLLVNLGVNISYALIFLLCGDTLLTWNHSVRNPNYFSVDFKNIEANVSPSNARRNILWLYLQITYPINNLPIGSGDASNILFKSRTETNFTFPFALVYNSTADTGSQVILDIAQKCGVTPGSTKQNIVVNYKITVGFIFVRAFTTTNHPFQLGIRILVVTISPVISNQFSFACPLSASDIEVEQIPLALWSYFPLTISLEIHRWIKLNDG